MELDAKRFTDGATLDTDILHCRRGPRGIGAGERARGSAMRRDPAREWWQAALSRRFSPSMLVIPPGMSMPGSALLVTDRSGARLIYGIAPPGARSGPSTRLSTLRISKFGPAAITAAGRSIFRSFARITMRAQRICGLGPFAYDAPAWATQDANPWSALGDDVVSRVYQFGARDALVAPLRATITRATNVRLCSHATAIAFETSASGRRVATVAVGTPGGPRWSVRAKRIVLAAGAVENARLLLLLNESRGLEGDGTEWVGRGFMEHPRDRAITLRPHSTALICERGLLRSASGCGW